MSQTLPHTPAHPQYPSPIVLDWPKALRLTELRRTRRGTVITPELLRSWAAGARDLASRWMPDYHNAWADVLESRARELSLEEVLS